LFEAALQSNSLYVRHLVKEPLVLVAAAGHPLTSRSAVSPIDLEDEPILFTEINCGYRPLFEHTLSAAGIHPNTNLEFYSLEAIKQCVIAGLGITLIPEVAVRHELATGKLVQFAWEEGAFAVWTQMVWSRHGYVCPAMDQFITLSESVLGSPEHEAVSAP